MIDHRTVLLIVTTSYEVCISLLTLAACLHAVKQRCLLSTSQSTPKEKIILSSVYLYLKLTKFIEKIINTYDAK